MIAAMESLAASITSAMKVIGWSFVPATDTETAPSLLRLASICLKDVVIGRQPRRLASFCVLGATARFAVMLTDDGSGAHEPIDPTAFASKAPWRRGEGRY